MVNSLPACLCVFEALSTLGVPVRVCPTLWASKRRTIFGNILLGNRHPSLCVKLLFSQWFVVWVMWEMVKLKIIETIAASSFLHW